MIVGQTVFPDYEGICPCGVKFLVFENPPAVAHVPPLCSAFIELDATEFLIYVRTQGEKHQ